MNNKIIIGSDHAGFELKNKLTEYLKNEGYDVTDGGTHTRESCDYPIIAKQVSQEITAGNYDKGILICGTGIGMSITANKIKGIRAAVVSDTCSAKFSRQHNNANILCLGSRIIGEELAKDITDIWLKSEFLADRHSKRLDMIE